MRSILSALACTLLLLSVSGSATAQEVNAPPGNAGIDEYLETVPAAGGNRGVTPDRSGSSAIGAETRGQLEAMGPEGKLAADLAEGGATAAGSGRSRSGDGGSDGVSALPDESVESPIQAVIEAVTGGAASDAGMGPVLPILLLLALATMLAVAIMRRRASG